MKIWLKVIISGCFLLLAACGIASKQAAESRSPNAANRGSQATAVDVQVAKTGTLRKQTEYIGTSAPIQAVSLRSQVEGQLLALRANLGDTLRKGEVIAQVDDALLVSTLNQAEAELAARKSEVARAQSQVSNARAAMQEAKLELNQAQSDSARFQQLFKEGAISAQQAQQSRTTAQTAAQVFRAAQDQVRTEQQAVAAAQGRVIAQQAIVAQAQKRRSYARVLSPINGVVIQRTIEPGSLVQPGTEVVKLGDFSSVKVVVQVSELDLSKVRVGQSVEVRLDAFPTQIFVGQVTRISPAADPTARLVPVEVTIPNLEGKIGSGLLARVSFAEGAVKRVVVPQTALEATGERGNKGAEEQKSGTVFVVAEKGEGSNIVTAKAVTLGDRADGQVEILSGLNPGERFVVRSGEPLEDGKSVRLSILSEKQ